MAANSEDPRNAQVDRNKARSLMNTPAYGLLHESEDDTSYLVSDTASHNRSTISQEADDVQMIQADPRHSQNTPYPYYPHPPPANPAYPSGPYMHPQGYYGVQGSHSTTTVIVQQPGQPQAMPPRTWNSQLCECGKDWSICCCGLFCLCCLESNVAQDMDESCMLPCCVPGWLITLRTKMRLQENISGSVMDDCCHVCCCYSCTLCQLAYEIQVVEERRMANATALRQVQM